MIEDYEAGCLIENIDILEQDDNDTPEADTVKMIAAELAGAIKALVAAPATSTGEGA